MLFNSVDYLIFLPVVTALYFIIPSKWRWLFLLVASYFFYASWNVQYAFILLGITLIDYFLAIRIAEARSKKYKKWLLTLSLVLSLGTLAAFKYLDFFFESINRLFIDFNILQPLPLFHVLMPIGISFYIFQSLSYMIDVYREIKEPERHFGKFALYVAFFPQIVSGPITRSGHLLPQIHEPKPFSQQGLVSGLKLMLWGFFKKVVIADRLGMFVSYVYDTPEQGRGLLVILATLLFAFQLYCDFSAYTDIARGSARILGYDLMINFNRPLIAKSLRDFWNRWHISLTTWFRDYLLYSLPYVRKNKVVYGLLYLNLVITFLLMGFWHGAAWTFIIFGLFHGVMLVLETVTEQPRNRFFQFTRLSEHDFLRNALGTLVTIALLTFSLVFFRASSLGASLQLMAKAADFSGTAENLRLMVKNYELIFGILMIVVLLVAEYYQEKRNLVLYISEKPVWFRWSVYIGFVFFILVFGVLQKQKFIYFQF
jgi:alginate O-acetyltransferase complex protein AlgI